MLLINYKIYLELSWTKNCVMSNVAVDTAFKNIKINSNIKIK